MTAALIVAFIATFAAGFLLRSVIAALAARAALDWERRISAAGYELIQLGHNSARERALFAMQVALLAACWIVIGAFFAGLFA